MNNLVRWRGHGRGLPSKDPGAVFAIEFQKEGDCSPLLRVTHQVRLVVETCPKAWLLFDAGYNFEVPLFAVDDVCAIVLSALIAELQYRVPIQHVAVGLRTNEADSFQYWDSVIQRVGDAVLRLSLDRTPYSPDYYRANSRNRSNVLSRFPCLLTSPYRQNYENNP